RFCPGGRPEDCRARQGGGRHQGRVRPWRVSVSWPREGAGRCRPRGRTGVLMMADETNQTEAPAEAQVEAPASADTAGGPPTEGRRERGARGGRGGRDNRGGGNRGRRDDNRRG